MFEHLPTQNPAGYVKKEKAWIYLCKTPKGYKIGKTLYLKERMKGLQKEHGDIDVLHYIEVKRNISEDIEYACHRYFLEKQNGYKYEYFDLSESDIEEFKKPDFLYRMQKKIEEMKINQIKFEIRKLRKQKRRIDAAKEKLAEMENKYNEEKERILEKIKSIDEFYSLIIDLKL
ncbi:hypothetical protein NrS5_20 [Nitratiruptor phage NrS-5]|uniref:GIY-YIG nuclease family protein n=1 Tax=unclassified Nitratiruptor TaxID=2624044 RepID=UPI0019161657|nr:MULTISPECIES: GIY-YIG nuclease family protein [unclassified Nitratiruptor]BCD61724.1 hypothetical protein NitYY0813_C0584 [Nitratiruptor sp. YY08-13]BCD65659.1 hypothetical protein NitYY0826_C0586 [Nitratiruptor sp. YY08-26]BCD83202.1 hypothetical protein NrS4_20 [Nitratiruptor phage NrS-4]BCD83261.1 hypothetical protein NrS5_20 [Nitratiruptor phage NrS-5]